MRVSICGKDGAGKTTLAATLARLHARGGGPVVAVDDDPNPNLAVALGAAETDRSRMERLPAELSLSPDPGNDRPPIALDELGFWEAGRGSLTHHMVLQDSRIANYQIVTPSTWMASPRDPFGAAGPYEEAVINTPLLEEFNRAEDFTGIDILRTLRSFDPCMPCTVHLYAGSRVLHRDATTCACGVEA